MHLVIRAWRDWTNGVRGWAGGGGGKGKKEMKTIFRMNGLFWGGSARRRERGGSGIEKKEAREMARERSATRFQINHYCRL